MIENGHQGYLKSSFVRFVPLTFCNGLFKNSQLLNKIHVPAWMWHHWLSGFFFKVNATTHPISNVLFKCKTIKQNKKKLWNFKSWNLLSNNPNHIYKSVQNKKMGTIHASAMSDSNFLYPLMVVHNFPFHQKLWVSTVSLSKLKLTLHLSMCIKAAYSIAWHKLFFKQ